jgi:hypothetical protein
MASGRISLRIDSPFRDMLILLRRVPSAAGKQAMKYARAEAAPIWKEETAGRATTHLQQRVLVDSSRVGATSRNIFLRSGGTGRLTTGTSVTDLRIAAEFGTKPGTRIAQRSSTGTRYQRRIGDSFGGRAPRGKVFHPAVSDAIVRVTSVIIQSFRREIFDALDGKK